MRGIHTPTLLQISGIWDTRKLEQLCIPTVYNQPNVGQNMTNHQTSAAIFTSDTIPSSDPNDLYSGEAFLPDPK